MCEKLSKNKIPFYCTTEVMCKYFDTDDPDVDTGHYTGYYTGRCYETNNIIRY